MSLWEKYLDNTNFKSLEKDIEIDTLIIGGGLTGLTTLYYLRNAPSTILIEASKVGFGVTKNTTGKLTYLQGVIYSDLEKNISKKVAKNYLQSQKYAISLIKEIIEKEKLDCDLEGVSSFVYALNNKEMTELKREKRFLEENYIKVNENKHQIGSYNISVEDTYVFNPIKYLNELKKIINSKQIYENTKVEKIENKNGKYICFTKNYKIIANRVIVACHYPFFLFPFCLPLKSYIEKSYLICYKTNKNEHTSGITVSNPGFSYRYYQDGKDVYKICLGVSHKTSVKQNDIENFKKVKHNFEIPDKDIISMWSNVDIMTDDKIPYIGKIKNNLYLATGFNTWGMTNGILAAKILSNFILNQENRYANLFQIKRMNKYKCKSFFSNTINSMIAFVGSKHIQKSWYKKKLEFKKVNGKSIAIYTDDVGKKHTVYTTCPHLKCSLVFNEQELTWDCPCHSSRFSVDGECIKGPSKYNISYKE